jgi:hypothetical protein
VDCARREDLSPNTRRMWNLLSSAAGTAR